MKRYAALILAAVLALLGISFFASGAQAQQAVYPTPSLTLSLSTQTVVSGHSFVGTARASIKCTLLTETWNGQSASAPGSKVTHVFKAPIVKKATIIPLKATCTFTTVTGTSGAAIAATTQTLSRTANVTVLPLSHPAHPALPDTGGPNLVWFIVGGAAVLAGAFAMFFSRRRRGDKVAH